MIFSEKFLASFSDDPFAGAVGALELVRSELDLKSDEWIDEDYQVLLEAYSLFMEILDSGLLKMTRPRFSILGDKNTDCTAIFSYIQEVAQHCTSESSKLKVASMRAHFKTAIGSNFSYEFSQGDLDRVQVLISQIRDLISQTEGLEDDHKRRLLARLEKLQSEMHKKVADLDRFWGLIGDAGIVLGKLGNDAKPIVDRIREVAGIVWQTQSRSEELPSGSQIPLITDGSINPVATHLAGNDPQ